MIREAIDRILELAQPQMLTLDGEKYVNKKMIRLPHELKAQPLEVHTLTAIVDYIMNGCDELVEDIDRKYVIHVADHAHVYLFHELNADKERECLLSCNVSPKTFPFGRWLDVESFIISMQAYFEPSDNVDALVKLVGNIVDENSVTTADDGMTQNVTARSGIALVKQMSVPNPITLAPYRTFNEIAQPESSFVFRVRKGANGVEAALFTADGNAWVNDAIQGIKFYFNYMIPQELREDVIILA